MERYELIPNHQFGFRNKHATIEQIHRIIKRINNDIEPDRYCTVVFLDVTQASDKIWHQGLLYKIKNNFPTDLYAIIRSYLLYKTFRIKYGEIIIQLKKILGYLWNVSGAFQDSILGPYFICYISLIFRSL